MLWWRASLSTSNTDDNFTAVIFPFKILPHDTISTRGSYSSGTYINPFFEREFHQLISIR